MANTNISVVKGDKLYNINFTIQQANPNDSSELLPVDLTDSIVKFKTTPINNVSSLIINGTCTVTVPADGKCYYKVQANDFSSTGQYRGELEVTYISGEVITAPKILINVIDKLGG